MRIDPIRSSTANAEFEIDWIRAFDPLGDADGDGIGNLAEGVEDVDSDGLPNYLDTNSDGDGLGDAAEVAAALDPYTARDMQFDFGSLGDQGWVGAGTVASTDPDVDGAFQAISNNNTPQDPQMIRDGLGFSADQVPMIRVRYEGEANGTLLMFWKNEVGGFSSTRRKPAQTSYVAGSGFVETTFDLASDPDWNGTMITSLRMDLINGQLLGTRVDWIRATDGDMDGDGLSDDAESTVAIADVDMDGLDNMQDTDSDDDGAPDALEASLGRNPYAAVEGEFDSDHDGQSDLFEMILGTSPDDRADHFTQSIAYDGNLHPSLTFSAKPGRRYVLERSLNLTFWTPVVEILSGMTDGEMTAVDPNPPVEGELFFRLNVELVE
jgi:hypothetical protein